MPAGPRESTDAGGPMRVLHVTQPVVAGVAEVVAALVAHQVGEGWEVMVACPSEGPLAALVEALGARHIPWAVRRAPDHTLVREVRQLTQIVCATEPDVVHLHSSKAGVAGRLAVRRRRPTVFQPHAWSFLAVGSRTQPLVRWLERRLSPWTDLVVCGSEDERSIGQAAGIRASMVVVPNSVDVERFRALGDHDRRRARQALSLDGSPLAICIGRLCRQKGQDILLDAWPLVLAQVPSARLVLVGDGPDKAALLARDAPRVMFAGWSDDVVTWLAAADVVVQPSRYETLALATLEAMASARSVVVSDAGGTSEAVCGSCGAVVPTGDVMALAQAIGVRLVDSRRATDEGRAARHEVVSRFALSSWAMRMSALMRDVVGSQVRS